MSQSKLDDLVQELMNLNAKFYKARGYDKYPGELGKPAKKSDLTKLESRLGCPLPAEYKEFLLKHEGWTWFDGEGKLLATLDHGTPWEKQIVDDWSEHWDSSYPDPFKAPYLMVFGGIKIPYFIVLDPNRKNANGEATFVEYEDNTIESVYDTFSDLLRFRIEVMTSLCKK